MPLPRFPAKHAVPPQLRSRRARALPHFAPLRYFLLQCFPLLYHEPLFPPTPKAARFRSFLFVPPAFALSRMRGLLPSPHSDSLVRCSPPCRRTRRCRAKQTPRLSLRCLSYKPARVLFSSCLSSRKLDYSICFNNCLLLNFHYVTTAFTLALISPCPHDSCGSIVQILCYLFTLVKPFLRFAMRSD